MLWIAMLRGTAVGLLTAAGQSAGATVSSSKDTPVSSGTMPWVVVYADDDMEGEGGGAPSFRTKGIVTVEVRGEAATRAAAETLLDTLVELVKRTLLTGQGFGVNLAMVNGSAIATPDSMIGLFVGMRVRGPGIPEGAEFVAIQSVNEDNTVTLTSSFPAASGTYRFNVGSFIALFEQIDQVKSFPEYHGENKKHVATATVEFHGHVHEVFQPAITQVLNGLNIYVDSINIFDPGADYPGEEPFAGVAPSPRTIGRDGRTEIPGSVEIDH